MKGNRHAKIIELIHKNHIETQEELADYLHVSPERVKILAKISLDALNGCDE